MQLFAPDLLLEARGLSTAMCGTLCALGVALWLFGWRWQRFWVVSGITLAAGLLGLNTGRALGATQVLAVGILMAVAAGMMALELARLFAFVAGGCGAWLAVQWVFPQAQELWAVFVSGGLFGVLLYRLWTMLLTSLAGVFLAGHAGLLLLERGMTFDAVTWVGENQAAINGGAVAMIVLGILLQAVATPNEEASKKRAESKKQKKPKRPHLEPELEAEEMPDEKPAPWWRRLFPSGKAA